MLKSVVFLAFWAAGTADFVGREFVSPELKARARKQQDQGHPTAEMRPVTASQMIREFATAVPEETQQNAKGPLDGVVTDAEGHTPELDEHEMIEAQMLLALRDIVRLEKYVPSLVGQITQRIFGDLENSLLINRFTQSFQMYDMILGVLQKYQLNKPIIVAKANYLDRAVKSAVSFIAKSNDVFIAMIDPDDPPEVREKNKSIFLRSLDQLHEEVRKLTEAILKELDDMFKSIQVTHRHPLKSDLQKIHQLLEISLNLIVFKKTTLADCAEKVLNLRREVLENPAYNSHLKKIKDDRISLSSNRLSALLGLAAAFLFAKL